MSSPVFALHHLDPEQLERRCELLLALARASFLLPDARPVERSATDAPQLETFATARRQFGADGSIDVLGDVPRYINRCILSHDRKAGPLARVVPSRPSGIPGRG